MKYKVCTVQITLKKYISYCGVCSVKGKFKCAVQCVICSIHIKVRDELCAVYFAVLGAHSVANSVQFTVYNKRW